MTSLQSKWAAANPSRPTVDTTMAAPLAACRWEWCRSSFQSQDELVEHVLHEHIDNVHPVKRKDLGILRRAEEGVSDGGE
ncbi:hypothetical protein BD410DRAFT_732066, partial [Rickenella mellea]